MIGILLVIAIVIYISRNLKRTYEKDVKKAIEREGVVESEILTLEDMKHLPIPVQKYLIHIGAVGKEKVHRFRVVADGKFKMKRELDWGKIKIEQNNFTGNKLIRLFYLKMNMFGIPIYVLHSYTDKDASMFGKFAGLFTVLNSKGNEMRISDTTNEDRYIKVG